MVSFHGKKELKKQLLDNIYRHKEMDGIIQGKYWENGKGCAVGCSLVDFGGDPSCHEDYERLFGVPTILAKLHDSIFERLSKDDSERWVSEFWEAVPVGVDLSLVWPEFAVWLLVDEAHGVIRFAKSEESKKAAKGVSSLYKRILLGDPVSKAEFAAAAYAADADAAAYAYAAAAAAAYATTAAATAYAAAAAAYAAAYADADADAAAYATAAAYADADAAATATAAATAYAATAAATAYAAAAAAAASYAAASYADTRREATRQQATKLIQILSDAA